MEQDAGMNEKIIREYHEAVEPLFRFWPWLEQHAGETGQTLFEEQGIAEHSLTFPVYDPMLTQFIREAGQSSLMDRNYPYVYSRNGLRDHADERALITKAGPEEWDQLRGILSRYVLGGRVKAMLWSEGVKACTYLLVLKRMKEIATGLEQENE